MNAWMRRQPMLMLAGIALASIAWVDATAATAPATLTGVAALTSALLTWRFPRVEWLALTTALTFATLHGVRLHETRRHPLRELIGRGPGTEVRAIGDLHSAMVASTDPNEALADHPKEAVFVTDSVLRIRNGRACNAPAQIRVRLPDTLQALPAGRYELEGTMHIPAPPANPGQFDRSETALRQGFVAELQAEKLRLLAPASLGFRPRMLAQAERCREWIGIQLSRGLEDDPDTIGVIRAMALGETNQAPEEVEQDFRDSGTMHVFAVSGLHVGMVSLVGWTLLMPLGLRRSLAILVLIGGVLAYAFITGWRPSAARAAIMIVIVLSAGLFDRRSSLLNSLGCAALVLLAGDSNQAFMPGFQLSFGVLLAIALLTPRLLHPLKAWIELDPFLPAQLASPRQHAWARVKGHIASTAAVSVAAWIGSLPLMGWHFSVVNLTAIAANCLLVPLSFCCLSTSCISLLFAATPLRFAQEWINNANWLFAKGMIAVAGFFASLPGAAVHLPPGAALTSRNPVELNVLHLAGGQAAQHLRVGRTHWLLDAGGKNAFQSVLGPYLQRNGVNEIEAVILSHSDASHTGGAQPLFRRWPPQDLLVSVLEPWKFESGASNLRQLLGKLESTHPNIRLQHLAAGDQVGFGHPATGMATWMEVLYPTMADLQDKADDRSIVGMIHAGPFRILWCGDIGFIAEKALLERGCDLQCDVLLRNRHASDYSGLPEFIRATKTRVMITSNQPAIPEERMDPMTLGACRSIGVEVFDQNIEGAVRISISPDQLTASGHLTGRTAVLRPFVLETVPIRP